MKAEVSSSTGSSVVNHMSVGVSQSFLGHRPGRCVQGKTEKKHQKTRSRPIEKRQVRSACDASR